jgi:uncharacterized protein YbcC (UPF0753/DUF2309 family)
MKHDTELRARIRSMVTIAFDAIPAVWPLGGFIATNPLSGFEHLPFAEALRRTQEQTGACGFLPEAEYRRRYRAGQISAAALESAFDRSSAVPSGMRRIMGRPIRTRELAWASLTHDLCAPLERSGLYEAAVARIGRGKHTGFARLAATPTMPLTFGELVDAICDTQVASMIDEQIIVWCAAFLDEGQAAWTMPYRDLGLYGAWRRLAPHDTSRAAHAIDGYRERLSNVFFYPEDTIAAALNAMRIPRDEWTSYLTMHARKLSGWAGIAKWRAAHPNDQVQRAAPSDPVQYLAIRLWYEMALVGTIADRRGLAFDREDFIARFGPLQQNATRIDGPCLLANVASVLDFSETEVLALEDDDVHWLVAGATALDADERGLIWLQAHEIYTRDGLLKAIAQATDANQTPLADVVFCIDVRSEGIRRHLERTGPYRTRGFAGFFGLPISFRALDSGWAQPACPVLLTPKHEIVEHLAAPKKHAGRYRTGRAFLAESERVLDEIKSSVGSSFVLFEAIGALFLLPLAGRTLQPRLFSALRKIVKRAIVPDVPRALVVEKSPHEADRVGFTQAERLFFCEAALALMGMRDNFARLVLFVGHGSTTENNPFEASLHCGACAGYRGGPNARVLAAMLSRDDVRDGLRLRGIDIPSTTIFAAAEHDTATDRVSILDRGLVPVDHRADLERLEGDLETAHNRLACERARDLGATRVDTRSADWAQVRPEWGLARNAAFIIAPRSMTHGVDLARRTFLHEYDVANDRDGRLLEIIMTAPLVVAQWINNHYYFATVDNERYGSGTKVIHNVVGRIGVMAGNRGDVRAGLPLQSLADRAGWFHEPLRLLAIVNAPRARIDRVIARNVILQRLFHNEWLGLAAFDPETNSFWNYRPDATWEAQSDITAARVETDRIASAV